jgi:DNA-directed RNA polymerase alpha subunit
MTQAWDFVDAGVLWQMDFSLAKRDHLDERILRIEGLSARTRNVLTAAGIHTIADLVQRGEDELLRVPNFGRRSVNEIKAVLAVWNLYLGMDEPGLKRYIPDFAPRLPPV